MINITKQLRRYFVLITLISVIFITIVSNIGINYFFRNYIRQSRTREDLQLVEYVQETYAYTQHMDEPVLANIMYFAHNQGLEVKIKDLENTVLFDSTDVRMMPGMPGMGMGKWRKNQWYNNRLENIVYQDYPLLYQDQQIGIIEIGRPGSILINSEDINFIVTMNGIYIITFIFSITIAVMISLYVSKKFLQPLLAVKENVSLIADEKYNKMHNVTTKTAELHELSDAIQALAQKLKAQEHLRKRLTSDIAHELRTPLATLQSHLEAFMDGVWEPTQERFASCYDEIIRLTKMIKDLSDLSGIESADIKLNKQKIDLSSLIEDITENFAPLLIGKEIQLHKSIQPNISMVGDADRLRQVFVNLLSNAYKYTDPHGQVSVKLATTHNKITAMIQDTGIGIPQKDIPYIFERFYRGDVSRSRKTGGTGIGLTITKAWVEAHDGKIRIESEEGKGTNVIIEFEQSS